MTKKKKCSCDDSKKKKSKKDSADFKMPVPTESSIEYQGSGFWLTVSSPKLKESKETFTELYAKLRKEKGSKGQKYHG